MVLRYDAAPGRLWFLRNTNYVSTEKALKSKQWGVKNASFKSISWFLLLYGRMRMLGCVLQIYESGPVRHFLDNNITTPTKQDVPAQMKHQSKKLRGIKHVLLTASRLCCVKKGWWLLGCSACPLSVKPQRKKQRNSNNRVQSQKQH